MTTRKKSRKKIDTFSAVYFLLVFLRVILVLRPQTGYIHPDEFFQAVEVLAGKFLDVEYSPPWEFTTNSPIRSMALPYFTIGMCYKFLKFLSNICMEYLPNINLLTPYLLLIIPRMLLCMLSFIVDYTVYKICSDNNEKYKSRLIILSSSYVMIIYGTRTFSNTFELILFALLLHYISESITFSNILCKRREYVNYRYEQSKTAAERAKFHKLRLFFVSDSYRNCFFISTITVIGFFNRPTFLCFAIIPIFFWLYRGIGTKTVTVVQFNTRILIFILCAIPSILFFVIVDSLYYGFLTWGEVGMLEISLNNFVFTPYNFLKYNSNINNLALHGLHPRYLHILVNIPLLYNVLGILLLYSLLKYIYWCSLKKINLLPSIRSIKCLMTLSFVTPILLLSLFPHQEPRFLIPCILPLVYLQGTSILPDPDQSVIKATKVPSSNSKIKEPSLGLLKIWLSMNMILTIFYGFIHQGGVYLATDYIAQELRVTPLTTQFYILTSHVYSLPESFLMQIPSNKIYSRGATQYTVTRRVHLHEEGSKDLEYILSKLNLIINEHDHSRQQTKVYLLIPNSLEHQLNYYFRKKDLYFNLDATFYPHLSIEAFPDFSRSCLEITKSFYESNCTQLSFTDFFVNAVQMFGLNLYSIPLDKNLNKTSINASN